MLRSSFGLVVAVAVVGVASFGYAATELPDRALTLDDCVVLALQHNPSLVIAEQGVRASEAGLLRSASASYPSVLFLGTWGRTGGTSFLDTPAGPVAFSTSGTRRDSEVLMSQTIWQTGRRESIRSARNSLQASQASEVAAVQNLVLMVSQAYYAALAAEQLVRVSEARLAAARDHEKLVRATAEVGEAPPVDVISAEANAAQAELSLIRMENNADLAKAQLKRAMGIPPDYRLTLAPIEMEESDEAIPWVSEALAVALERRPEMEAVRHSVAAAQETLDLAKAVEPGVISLSAQYSIGISGAREDEDAWSAFVSATGFLFDGGGRKADVDAARAGLEIVRAQEQQVASNIGLEVESAVLEAATARKSIDAALKSVSSAESGLAASQVKYREGVGIFVEVLDAQETLTRAQTDYVRAMYDYHVALVGLRKATGTLEAPEASGVGL
jgi:outer membrane protein TolC